MNIVCRKTKCKYNDNLACRSPKIFIDRELNCEQYEPVEKGSLQDISKNMMETAPEISTFRHNKDIRIKCHANCVFNKDCECMANGIFINGQTPTANTKIRDLTLDDEDCESGASNECGQGEDSSECGAGVESGRKKKSGKCVNSECEKAGASGEDCVQEKRGLFSWGKAKKCKLNTNGISNASKNASGNRCGNATINAGNNANVGAKGGSDLTANANKSASVTTAKACEPYECLDDGVQEFEVDNEFGLNGENCLDANILDVPSGADEEALKAKCFTFANK